MFVKNTNYNIIFAMKKKKKNPSIKRVRMHNPMIFFSMLSAHFGRSIYYCKKK